jgi:hypothetical protein
MRSASRRCCPLSILVLAFALTGCGGDEHVVAWADVPYEAGPPIARDVPAIPRGARPCRAGELEVRFRWNEPFSLALVDGTLTVRNVGRSACVVGGLPRLVQPAGGLPLDLTGPVLEPADGFWAPEGYPDSNPRWGLRPGGVARAGLLERFPCFEPGNGRGVETVRLAGVPVRIAICLHARAQLMVGPLVPPALPARPATRFPFRARIVGKPTGRPGEPLSFRVRVTNSSTRTFRFPFCPYVEEGVDGGSGAGGGTLNCHGVKTIGPGRRVVFEMRTDPLRFFRPGRHELRWQLLNEVGATQAAATASFTLR